MAPRLKLTEIEGEESGRQRLAGRERKADERELAKKSVAPTPIDADPLLENMERQDLISERTTSDDVLRRRMLPTSSGALDNTLPALDLPQRIQRRSKGGFVSFIACVVLPVIAAAIYYYGYASDQYAASFNFIVRDTTTSSASSSISSPFLAMLGVTSSASPAENYMVTEYIMSRQGVDDLQRRISVTDMYSSPSIDWWSRFDSSKPIERFLKYWQYMASATFDEITGTAVVQVRAFSPEDAYKIATTLVSLSEDLINEIERIPLMEAVRFAEAELARSEQRLKEKRNELSMYRNKEGLIEPTSSVVLSNATLASTIRATVAQIQTEISAAEGQKLNANAPLLRNLKVRLKATQDQLAAVEAQVGVAKTGNSSLSQVVARYEELDLERQFAQNMVLSTMQSLDQARANAQAKHLYITPYVRPAMPQTSLYPNRPVAILTVAGACFLFWTIALLIVRSLREHLA